MTKAELERELRNAHAILAEISKRAESGIEVLTGLPGKDARVIFESIGSAKYYLQVLKALADNEVQGTRKLKFV